MLLGIDSLDEGLHFIRRRSSCTLIERKSSSAADADWTKVSNVSFSRKKELKVSCFSGAINHTAEIFASL